MRSVKRDNLCIGGEPQRPLEKKRGVQRQLLKNVPDMGEGLRVFCPQCGYEEHCSHSSHLHPGRQKYCPRGCTVNK